MRPSPTFFSRNWPGLLLALLAAAGLIAWSTPDLSISFGTAPNRIKLQVSGGQSAPYTITFPDDDGDAGDLLQGDGSGSLGWAPAAALASPSGAVMMFAGATAPAGWALGYGQAVSRTDEAALFAVIGTTYGAGDGSTTFNLPDCRGRTLAGKDDMGGVAAGRLTAAGTGNPGIDGTALGAAGGVDRYALSTAELSSHSHADGTLATSIGLSGSAPALGGTTTFPNTSHTHSGTSLTAGWHSDGAAIVWRLQNASYTSTRFITGLTGSLSSTSASQTTGIAVVGNTGTPSANTSQVTISGGSYSLTGSNAVTGSTDTAGSGNAHPNVQPTIVMNCIIKL